MKKKGFTLTEMLGVITILGLVALIVFPNVNKAIKNSKNKLYERQVNMIESNARRWGLDNTNLLPTKGAYYLKLNDLVEGKYISNKEIKDPRDNTIMDGCIIINYNAEYNQHEYQYVETKCSENKPQYPTLVEKVKNASEIRTNDPDKNSRYVGKNPNNYVWFNDELWRVIGEFDGQVKIMRKDFYSEGIAWTTENANDWSKATLQLELNGTYLNSINSTYKDMIVQDHVWNLGSTEGSEQGDYRKSYYNYERSTVVREGNPITWTGAIALMYPSDYGYATDKDCENVSFSEWSKLEDSTCAENSWIYDDSHYQWTLMPSIFMYAGSWGAYTVGGPGMWQNGFAKIDGRFSGEENSVRPVLFLKSNVGVTEGNGSVDKPYKLILQ